MANPDRTSSDASPKYERMGSHTHTNAQGENTYSNPGVHVEVGYSDPVDSHEYDEVIYNDEAIKKETSVENFAVIDLNDDNEPHGRGGAGGNNKPDLPGRTPERNSVYVDEEGSFMTPAPRYLLADKVIEEEIKKEEAGTIYAAKKTIAQGMLDIALLTANTSQLRVVIQSEEHSSMRRVIITFISFSIALQVLVGLCLLYIGTLDKEHSQKKRRANILNNVVTMFIFIITIINVMVSSFGLENMHHGPVKSAEASQTAPQPLPPPSPLIWNDSPKQFTG